MKAFIMSQLASSPLIWMFCDRNINFKINVLNYRALKIVYRHNVSSSDELLIKDKSLRVLTKIHIFLPLKCLR